MRPSVAAIADAFGRPGARVLDTHRRPRPQPRGDHAGRRRVGARGRARRGHRRGPPADRPAGASGRPPARRRGRRRPCRAARPGERRAAVDVARAVGARVGEALGLPVFLYGEVGGGTPTRVLPARRPVRAAAAGRRRGARSGIRPGAASTRRVARCSSACERRSSPSISSCGGRSALPATSPRPCASRPAGSPACRRSGCGSGADGVQVSTNVIDLDATPPHALVERIVAEAAARGAEAGPGSSSGSFPLARVADAARAAGVSEPLDDRGVPTEAALEAAARALRLERLDADRVLEWHLTC